MVQITFVKINTYKYYESAKLITFLTKMMYGFKNITSTCKI